MSLITEPQTLSDERSKNRGSFRVPPPLRVRGVTHTMANRMAAPLSAQEEQDKWLHGETKKRKEEADRGRARVWFFRVVGDGVPG